jgi:hypothetical protein
MLQVRLLKGMALFSALLLAALFLLYRGNYFGSTPLTTVAVAAPHDTGKATLDSLRAV